MASASPSDAPVRWPALDGVRAIAVGLVLGVHSAFGNGDLELGPVRGGFIGVDVFFVLSGFLVTTLLVRRSETGRVHLTRFFERRILRLVPALLVLCAAALALAIAFQSGTDRANTLEGILATITFSSDIAEARAIDAHVLGHTWSLAIEAQFYLVWGAVLWALLRVWAGRRVLAATAMGIAACIEAWRWTLWSHLGAPESAGDPVAQRLYFSPDTRSEALFVGVALAFVLLHRGPVRTRVGRAVAGVLAVAGLGVLLVVARLVNFRSDFLYGRGGFSIVAVAAALLVYQQVAAPAGPLTALLASPPMRWLGERSYSIYLWHWPIFFVVTPERMQWEGEPTAVLRLMLTLAVSSASFALVERPFLRIKDIAPA